MAKERYVSTVTFYVYGDDPQEALNNSQKICGHLKDKYDNRADTEELHLQMFGTLGSTKIDLKPLNK